MRLLTQARDLSRRKARERDRLFVVEGVRAVEELLKSKLDIVGVLCAPQLTESERGQALRAHATTRNAPLSDVTDREFASAASTESPQGVLAVARVPEHGFPGIPANGAVRLLVLDAVQDPGNVGTILRTAAALGASATIALPGTVDLWNAKVVRSAMGAHFFHTAFHASWEDVDSYCTSHSISLWGADAGGRDVALLHAPDRLALVVGNEGGGLSPLVRSGVSELVSLPLADNVESLNVAVATGILLYQLRP